MKKAKLSERVGTKKAKLSIMPKAFEKGEVSSGKKRKKAKLSIMRSTCVAFEKSEVSNNRLGLDIRRRDGSFIRNI